MDRLLLPSPLDGARRVLLAGAGGGYDVYATLPLLAALEARGAEVVLANLSFTYLGGTDAPRLTPSLYCVSATSDGPDDYFPERTLARFLEGARRGRTVYAIEKVGVAPVREAYRAIVERHGIDAIVLVDGGTDLLMRGDEERLGTPEEDATSLAAIARLEGVVKLAICVGFGIDHHHGVSHALFLENVAALAREGGFLGTQSLLASMPEARLYLEAVEHAEHTAPKATTIVNTSIASAIEGRFGDHHRTERTRGGELFINPLMAMLWAFDLEAVARANLYLPALEGTVSIFDVEDVLELFRERVKRRPARAIPH
jgi:hypothetical protein